MFIHSYIYINIIFNLFLKYMCNFIFIFLWYEIFIFVYLFSSFCQYINKYKKYFLFQLLFKNINIIYKHNENGIEKKLPIFCRFIFSIVIRFKMARTKDNRKNVTSMTLSKEIDREIFRQQIPLNNQITFSDKYSIHCQNT